MTETKEARALIASAVFGLVLVLSPVIVFSIINPKILNLDITFGNLAPNISPTAAPSAATTQINPDLAQKICGGYTTPQWTQVPYGGFCKDSLNNPAETNIPALCCSGAQPSGGECCGVSTTYVAPTPPPLLSQFEYTVVTQDTNYDTGKPCLVYSDVGNFKSQAECLANYQTRVGAIKGAYAVSRSCTDTTSHTPTGPGAAALNSLAACPR